MLTLPPAQIRSVDDAGVTHLFQVYTCIGVQKMLIQFILYVLLCLFKFDVAGENTG